MNNLKEYFSQRRVWAALAVPVTIQLVFFVIMLPAINGTTGRVNRLHVAVVSADPAMGDQIAAQVAGKLPFSVDHPRDLSAARSALSSGDVQMIISIPRDFTNSIESGTAKLDFEIAPSAAATTKQMMAAVAQNVSTAVNAIAFGAEKQAIGRGIMSGLQGAQIPPQVASKLGQQITAALSGLNPNPVSAKIVGADATAGAASAIVPMFVILLGFAGALGMITLLRSSDGAPWALLGIEQLLMAAMAIVLPWVTIGLLALFGQPLGAGALRSWWLLGIGYWSMLLFINALLRLLGRVGVVVAGLLVPFQMIASGVLLPAPLLPSFYSAVSEFTPGPYAAKLLLTVGSGGEVNDTVLLTLLVIIAASLVVGTAATFIPRKRLA